MILYKSAKRVLLVSILATLSGFLSQSCQHARIRISPPIPAECKPWAEMQSSPECQAKREVQWKSLEEIPTTVKEYDQIYYYWGLKPNEISLRLDEECPQGVYEIHQFSTFQNALYEQLTLGFYSPRTLRLTCFTKNPYPEDSPPPSRRKQK